MAKKLTLQSLILLLLIMIFFVSPANAFSQSNVVIDDERYDLVESIIEPFWISKTNAESYLRVNGSFINCGGIVQGKSGTSKISATMTLEERDGWSWRRVDHWSKISYSDYLSMSGSYRAVSGRTYRLTINADVTVNGVVERVSNSTEIRF